MLGFVGSAESSDGASGKAVLPDEAKLFKEEKFGVPKPNVGNAPNGGIEGNPNGKPQGRSKNNDENCSDSFVKVKSYWTGLN